MNTIQISLLQDTLYIEKSIIHENVLNYIIKYCGPNKVCLDRVTILSDNHERDKHLWYRAMPIPTINLMHGIKCEYDLKSVGVERVYSGMDPSHLCVYNSMLPMSLLRAIIRKFSLKYVLIKESRLVINKSFKTDPNLTLIKTLNRYLCVSNLKVLGIQVFKQTENGYDVLYKI